MNKDPSPSNQDPTMQPSLPGSQSGRTSPTNQQSLADSSPEAHQPNRPAPGQMPYQAPGQTYYQAAGPMPNQAPYQAPNQTPYQRELIARTSHVNMTASPYPVRVQCQICLQEVITVTSHRSGLLAWLLSGFLCIIGCCLGCCLIPFCVNVGLIQFYQLNFKTCKN